MFIKQKHKVITETWSISRGGAKIAGVEPGELIN